MLVCAWISAGCFRPPTVESLICGADFCFLLHVSADGLVAVAGVLTMGCLRAGHWRRKAL